MKVFKMFFLIFIININGLYGQIGLKYIIPEILFDDVDAIRTYQYDNSKNLHFKIEKKFDKHGNLIRVEKFGSTERLIEYSEIAYPEEHIKEIITYNSYGDFESKIGYLFNDYGLYEINEYNLAGLFAKYVISYDSNLKVNKISDYDAWGKLKWTYEFQYDSMGKLIKENMYNSSLNRWFKYNYDEYNNIAGIENLVDLTKNTIYNYYYDEFSNWIYKETKIIEGTREKLTIDKRIIFYSNDNEYKTSKVPKNFRVGKPNFRIGMLRFGINNTMGADLMLTTKNNITLGVGAMAGRKKVGVGEHYTVVNWDQYPEDIYEYRANQGTYGYFIIGYTLPKFPIYFNLTVGLWSNEIVQNRYDEFRILGNNGYYFLTAPYEEKVMIGGLLFYDGFSDKKGSILFRPYLGYENFSGLSLGIFMIFDFSH